MPRPHRKPGVPKVHHSYTVEEVATLRAVHKNTVRNWLRQGLPCLSECRPLLILGRDLIEFESSRRRARKRLCGPGLIYCVRCREPRRPSSGTTQFIAALTGAGCVSGTCEQCGATIFRRIGAEQLKREHDVWRITPTKEQEHIVESFQPFVNCDFKQE